MIEKVVVNGTFDILHLGHIRLLEYARELGWYLLVLIDSDRRVQELKGLTRPINNQEERAEMLRAIRFVDEVQIFDSDDELRNIIKEYQPDYMVKGSDYRNLPIIGKEYCKEIKFYEYMEGYSTTKKISSIINR
jgi:D-beta-D-heptose 7-phosphate kinase/D-beta-D-heptose 1-phosphate adenosyltransferase